MKNGWPVTRLGDLTDLVTKGTTPTSIGHAFVEAGINFVKVESITTTGQFIQEKFAHITQACHAVLGRSQLQAGDILFSIAGALGRTGFVTDDILPANTNQALAIIRLKRNVSLSPRFVLKALETGVVLEQIEKFKGGVAQQNLSLAQVRDFQIALPSLPEQQRIVSLLDEAFAGIATAKANAEKNLQNARALFESHLQSVFTQRGPGWLDKPVSEIAKHSLGKMLDKAKNKGAPQPYLRNINVRWFTFDLSNLLRMPFLADEAGKYTAIKGDVLICEGGYPGRAAIWDKDYPIHFQKALHRVRFHQPEHNKWFVYYLSAQDSSGQLAQHFSGTGIQHFTGEVLARFTVPIPPLRELRLAVPKFDELNSETQRLARIYELKLVALDALKKSLLHQAFSGQL